MHPRRTRIHDPPCNGSRRALQTAVSVHRAARALELVIDAERHLDETADPVARAEVAAVRSQVSFFAGSAVEALRHADLAIISD
jgi:hypothetical protein